MRKNRGRLWRAPVMVALAALVGAASCEREPTKSDYVSARVTEVCAGRKGEALQLCRLAIIKRFKDVPLEEMQARYPKPEPRQRPACGF